MVEINNKIQTTFETNGLEEAISKLNKLNKEREELQKNNKIDINVKNQKLNSLSKDISDVEKEIKTTAKSISGLEHGIENIYSTRAKQAISQFETGLSGLNRESEKLKKTLDKIDYNQLTKTKSTLLDTEQALKNNNTAVEQLRNNFGVGMMQTAAFGSINALGSVFSDALQQVEKIDKVLTDIQLVSSKTTEEMQAYSKYAGDAAGQLGSTKEKLLEGNLIFEQQGGQAAQYAKQYGEQVVIGANISGESTDDVSQYLTSTMNGMDLINKKGASAAKYVNDVFGELGAVSGSDYGELAKSLAQFANISSNSGFSLEQSGAMSAVISEVTRKAPEAVGTALKSTLATFQQLSKDKDGQLTSKVEKAFGDAGLDIQLKKTNGEMRKTEEIFNELGDKWKDLNDDQKGIVSSSIAGKHHGESFQALMNNWDRYQELYEDAQNSSGAALRQQEIYMNSIEAKMNQLKNTWQDYVTSLGASDVFKNLLGFAQGFAEQMSAGENSVLNIAKGLMPIGNLFMQFYGKQKIGGMARDRAINQALSNAAKDDGGSENKYSEAYWVKNGGDLNDKQFTWVKNQVKYINQLEENLKDLENGEKKLLEKRKEAQTSVDSLTKTLDKLDDTSEITTSELKKIAAEMVNLTVDEKNEIKQNVKDVASQGEKRGTQKLQSYGLNQDEASYFYNQLQKEQKVKQSVEDTKNIENYKDLIDEISLETSTPKQLEEMRSKINEKDLDGIKNFDKLDKAIQEYILVIQDDTMEAEDLKVAYEEIQQKIEKYGLAFNEAANSLQATADTQNALERKLAMKIGEKIVDDAGENAKKTVQEMGKNTVQELNRAIDDTNNQITQSRKTAKNLEEKRDEAGDRVDNTAKAVEKGNTYQKVAGALSGLGEATLALTGTFQAIQEHGGKMDEEFEDIISSGLVNFGAGLMAINPILGSLTMAFGALADALDLFKSTVEKTREANEKLNEVYLAQNEKIGAKQSLLNDNEDLLKKYGNMTDEERTGAFKENPGDKEKWEGVTQQLAEQYPDLVQGTDENGKAIINLKGGYDELKNKLQEEKLNNNKMLANNAEGFGSVIKADLASGQSDIDKYQAKIQEQQKKLQEAQQIGDAEEIADATSKLAEYQQKLSETQQDLADTKTSITTNLINPIFDSNEAFQKLTGEARKAAVELKGNLFNSETVQNMINTGTSIKDITDKMENLANNSAKLAKNKGFKELTKKIDAQDYIGLTSNDDKELKRLKAKQKDLSDNNKKNDKNHNENAGLKFAKAETKEYKKQNKELKQKEENAKKANEEYQKNQRSNLLSSKTGAPESALGQKKEIDTNKKKKKADDELEAAKVGSLEKALNTLTPAYAEAAKSQEGFKESSQELTEVLEAQKGASGEYKQSLQDTAFAMTSGMAEANDSFYQSWINGSRAMVEAISDMYGVDLRNFKDAASAKAAFMASLETQNQVIAQSVANGDSEEETRKKAKTATERASKITGENFKQIVEKSQLGATYKADDGKTYKNSKDAIPDAIKAGNQQNTKIEEAQKAAKEANDKAAKRKQLQDQLDAAEKKIKDEKDKEKKEEEEKPYNQFQALQKEADKYYAITEALNEMNRAYDKIKRARDNAYSTDKLAIMQQEEAQLKENIKTAKTAEGIYQQEANSKKAALAAKGFTFDSNGTIANKNAIMDQMTSAYNNRAMELNQQKESPEAQKEMENRQQAIEDTEKLVAEYEDANSKLKEQQDSIEDIKQQLSDLQAEKYEIKINIIGDAIDQQAKIIDTLNEINKTEDTFSSDNAARNQVKAQALMSQFDMARQMYDEVKNDPKLTDAAREEKLKELTDVMTSSATEAMSAVESVNEEIDKFIDKLSNEFETINKNVDRIMNKAQGLADINGKIYGEDSPQYMEQVQNLNKLKDVQDDISRSAIESYKAQQKGIDTTTEQGKKQYQELQDLINSEEDKISQNFQDRLDNAQQGMENLTNKVIEDFDKAGSHIDRALNTLDKLNKSYGNIYGEDSEAFNKQEEQVQKMREVQMEHAKDTIEYFKKQQAMIDTSTKSGKEQWEQYQKGIEAAEDLLVDGMITTLEELNERMKRINETVINSFNKAYDQTNRIIQKTNEYKDAFLNFTGNEFDKDYGTILKNVNNARQEQNKVAQDAIDFYKTQMAMIDTSTKAGKEQYETMQKEVEKMGDAIQKNLTDGMKEYESAMKSITNETIKRFKDIANITNKIVQKQNQLSNMAKQVYGDTSSQYLDSLNNSGTMRNEQDKIAKQTIQFYQEQQKQLDLTTKAGKEQWQQYQQGIEEAEDLINNNLSQALSDLQAQMEVMNKKVLKEFKNAFGSDGLDNLQSDYNLQNKAQEKYLSGLEKANVLASKRAEIQEKMSHSNNNEEIAMYNKYLKETLVPLENAKTINQNDLEIAQAKLEVAKAELEVKRQGDADMQTRLVRDSQGNMTYEYYQKQSQQGQDAVAKYNNALDNLQEKMRSTVKSTAQEIQDTFANMQNIIQKMAETNDEEERKRLQKQLEAYQQYYNQLMEEYKKYSTMFSAEQVQGAFDKMNQGAITAEQLGQNMGISKDTVNAMNKANQNGMSFDQMASMSQEDLSSQLGISMEEAGAAQQGLQNGGGMDIQSLSSMIQNMYDTWQAKSEETLNKINDNFNNFSSKSQEIFNKAKEDVNTYGDKASAVFEKINGKMSQYVEQSQSSFNKLKDGYDSLAEKAKKSMNTIDKSVDKSYIKLAKDSVSQFKKASKSFEEYADTVKSKSKSAFNSAEKEFSDYNSKFKNETNKSLKSINSYYNKFKETAQDAMNKVNSATKTLTSGSKSLESQLYKQKNAADKVKDSAYKERNALDSLKKKNEELASSIRKKVNTAFTGNEAGNGKGGLYGAMTKNANYAQKEYKSALDKANKGTTTLSGSTKDMTKKFGDARDTMKEAYGQAIKFDTNNAKQGKLVKDGIDKIAGSTKNLGSNASDAAAEVAKLRDQLAQLDKGEKSSGKEKDKGKNTKKGGNDDNKSGNDDDKKGDNYKFEGYRPGLNGSFDTGGYTGEWTNSGNNKEGRIALLHEKELVLNKEDTANILKAVSLQRELMNLNKRPDLNIQSQSPQNIEQNVNIQADFPNVNSEIEIKNAFNGLKAEAMSYISNQNF